MSEYQYYEFQAIDRPLSEKEQAVISRLSRRVDLTPTRAVFTYQFGNFPGDPKKIVEKYFDAMLYLANWGTKQLMFRLPRSLVDAKAFAPYCFPHVVSTSVTRNYVILDICASEEGDGFWVEGAGRLSSLAGLRQDLLRGDFRVLYLAWLKAAQLEGELEEYEGQLEPPVPTNLRNLSAPLKSFAELFEIDKDLIAVASETDAPQSDAVELDLTKWVAKLPEVERNDFLVRIARGEPHVDVQLIKRLQELSSDKLRTSEPSRRRTIAELLAAAHERAERQREQQRRKAEKARIRKLDELAQKEPQLWEQVFALIEKKQVNAYDDAVKLLVELRELAQHIDQMDCFKSRINQIYEDYRNRPGLLSRLGDAGLVKDTM